MTERQQRGYYRIEYPIKERPTLETPDGSFAVIECSETGVRFARAATDTVPDEGARLRGTIHFRTGREVEVVGVVARVQEDTVAARLTSMTIPFRTILKEQQDLRRRFLEARRP